MLFNNTKKILFSCLCLVLFLAANVLADDENPPRMLGLAPSFIDNAGSFTIAYKDNDGAQTLKSVRLVIGHKNKNSHEFAIEFDATKNRVSIKADGGEWKSADLIESQIANQYMSIDITGLAHNINEGHGWVIIPVSFHASAILGSPGYEIFDVYATVKDEDSIRTKLEKHTAITIEYAMDEIANSIEKDSFAGSEYKWKNWSGDQVEIKLELTTNLPQEKERKFDLEDAGDLFFYSPASGKVTMAAILPDVKVSNVTVETKTVDERYKQFINFRLDFAEEQDAEDELIIRIYDQNSRGDYKLEAACAVPIWNIPTWWLPVTGYWFF